MTSSELAQLTGMLAAGGPNFSDDAFVVREQFDTLLDSFPVDPTLAFDPRVIGGISGLWLEAAEPSAAVMLYLHGGAYVVGTASGYRGLAAGLARAGGFALFAIDYRLAPEHVFPAAIDDALAAYRGLLESGIDASGIVVAGDSAGGGLALSLLVAIGGAGLPQPATAILLSPWTDLSLSGDTMTSKAGEDNSLDEPGLRLSANRYLGGASPTDPLASPLFADLTGLPPLHIAVGSAEVLLDDSTRLAALAGAAGVDVSLRIWPHMVHDWSLFAFMLSEGSDLIREAGIFAAQHVAVAELAS